MKYLKILLMFLIVPAFAQNARIGDSTMYFQTVQPARATNRNIIMHGNIKPDSLAVGVAVPPGAVKDSISTLRTVVNNLGGGTSVDQVARDTNTVLRTAVNRWAIDTTVVLRTAINRYGVDTTAVLRTAINKNLDSIRNAQSRIENAKWVTYSIDSTAMVVGMTYQFAVATYLTTVDTLKYILINGLVFQHLI